MLHLVDLILRLGVLCKSALLHYTKRTFFVVSRSVVGSNLVAGCFQGSQMAQGISAKVLRELPITFGP